MGVSLRYILKKPIEKKSQMDNLNIHAYKAVLPNGSHTFACKLRDERGITSMLTIELLVEEVVDNIRFFSDPSRCGRSPGNISIDFRPYHDIEYSGAKPRLCMSLTEEEVITFWDIFITK